MIVVDKPPVPPIRADPGASSGPEGQLRRCTLCLSWRPTGEMVEINPSIVSCTGCALRYPELVPPPKDVLWPVVGFLVGACLGWLLSFSSDAAQLVPGGSGLWCAVIGLAAGLGSYVFQTRHSAR